jgi:hypothetical protein
MPRNGFGRFDRICVGLIDRRCETSSVGQTAAGSECFRIPDFGNLTMKLFGELRGLALAVCY